ncbi:RNA pseudouridine synthase [Amycolatopsis antarctica]|uniref:RNA pseudouridylate synthase n=1 Tax=Amycolatopsis antarctica TaxID=1854586 RepID=A0A263DAL2_9PSEU|nr:RNA pseudouridine synthase [Amycolatopsis antarctica]
MASGKRTWADIREGAVLYEDDAALLLNKPTGVSVLGERHDTDLVRLARDAGEELFAVHRIDKVTSGAILFAKELRHHGDLTRQFNKRTVGKAYLVLTRSSGLPARGRIDLPLSAGRKGRTRIAAPRDSITEHEGTWSVPASEILSEVKTYPSTTEFATVWTDGEHSLLVARPVTGRRHQIRVHLAWIGHPIEGDPLFDRQSTTRTCLHSWYLAFDAAWADGTRIARHAAPDAAFWAPAGAADPSALLTAADAGLATLLEN